MASVSSLPENISGITFIGYAQCWKIRMPNDLQVFGSGKAKEHKQDSHNRVYMWYDNWWSRDNFSNQITDADKACRSSEISIDLIIIIVFL
jgi:hypothetical protein